MASGRRAERADGAPETKVRGRERPSEAAAGRRRRRGGGGGGSVRGQRRRAGGDAGIGGETRERIGLGFPPRGAVYIPQGEKTILPSAAPSE